MIPKVINYCWFGKGAKPKLAEKCIESWKKFFPDYQIKEWNEDNFDVNAIPYTAEAYAAGKYAFVSDYARFKILYDNGGVYFDTDVEVIKSFDDILAQGGFMGLEKNPVFENSNGSLENNGAGEVNPSGLGLAVNPGLGLAVAPGLGLYKDIVDKYSSLHFKKKDGSLCLTTIVSYVTNILIAKGLAVHPGIMEIDGIKIYPAEYFNPKGLDGKIVITSNTYSIHHYAASWYSAKQRVVAWVVHHVGLWPGRLVSLCWNNPLDILPRIIKFLHVGH